MPMKYHYKKRWHIGDGIWLVEETMKRALNMAWAGAAN
jgi:hypothetical protein